MRVLITNIILCERTGTEINVRDIALGLLGRGHTPIVYSPELGGIAEELRRRTVTVTDDLDAIGMPPDVIHGHHHPETMLALLRFPGVPAIYFSHDATAWHDAAPYFPRIGRYVAVDEANRDRLALEHGIGQEQIRVVLNAVDLERFPPREPLPPRPRRALVFSNYASEHTHALAIREACRRVGLPLDVVGANSGAATSAPEQLLGRYDLVFAKGRCALEALAVGTAVVLIDYLGLGRLVTAAEVDHLRRHNFGRRVLVRPLDPDLIVQEIARYDADDAARVSQRVRATAGLEAQLDALLALYAEVVSENTARVPDAAAEARAAAVYYREWGARFRDGAVRAECDRRGMEIAAVVAERDGLALELDRLRPELAAVQGELAQALADGEALGAQHREAAAQLAAEREALERRIAGIASERDRVTTEFGYVIESATWRLREVLVRSRPLVAIYRAVRALTSLGSRRTSRPAWRSQSG